MAAGAGNVAVGAGVWGARLDYVIEAETAPRGGQPDFRVKVGATGRGVVSFGLGELLDCYPDGRVVAVQEAAEA